MGLIHLPVYRQGFSIHVVSLGPTIFAGMKPVMKLRALLRADGLRSLRCGLTMT